MNISLKQLNVFIAITQHRTLSAASESLCLSKAAVSLSLGELEKQLGHTLFDRVNNRLVLNQQGQLLLPLADELISRAHNIEQLFVSSNTLIGHLHIGASNTVGNQVVPLLLSRFREKYNHFNQTLVIANTEQVGQKLIDFELDVGLIEGELKQSNIKATPWFFDNMVIVASPTHPLAKHRGITLQELEKQAWLLREPGSGTREYFIKHLAANLTHWKESFELNTTEAIINAASANLGLACLSQLSIQSAVKDERVVCLDFPLTTKRDYWLIVHNDKYQSPLVQKFIEFCLDYQGIKID
ncbi:LysR substrate-binding domain-containing protein [Vibrio sp. DW001]|uniref:LysR substrate-binding domain-containing protein n=1 Tax=Vibrio sp. DW001 TaxID=2912315 RepID=UPI0023AFB854|nr:LysR substrate-binding domain-containing protein [Vibrio sp. DW001]WED26051.1 LysR substrate-binding domain-containing protein [Vibrio sp. DW001]